MKRALIIAYQFPPMGGPGVQRSVKFVKYLQSFGWEPIVFTRDVGNMRVKDDSLLKDIPSNVKVIRTNPWDLTELPGVFSYVGKVIARKILIPDGERLWQQFSTNQALKIIKSEKIDLIYTTSYPYSDHLMGLKIKEKIPNIPWVADFRDEWTNNPYLLDNPHYHLRMNIEKRMESQVLKKANQIITNTPIMLRNFLSIMPEVSKKIHVIPNGYDQDDFINFIDSKPSNDRFTITYTGGFYGRRKPDLFLEAVSELIDENLVTSELICINLIGNFKIDVMKKLIEKNKLEKVVKVHPYMEHTECMNRIVNSDALLLIEGAGPGCRSVFYRQNF